MSTDNSGTLDSQFRHFGGEEATLPAENVKNKRMGKVWRTDTMEPRRTTLTLNHGSSKVSSAVMLGNISAPENGTKIRVQRGDSSIPGDVTDLIVYPNSIPSSTNVTGGGADIRDEDPESASTFTNKTTPTVAGTDMEFRIRFEAPHKNLVEGEGLQAFRLSCRALTGGNSPTIQCAL